MTVSSIASNTLVPEVLADAVRPGFAGMAVLAGTGAAIVSDSMPYGPDNVGSAVKVPYIGSLGEFADITDGNASVPVELTDTAGTATVLHSALSVEYTRLAQLSSVDGKYEDAARQILDSAARRIDKALIDAAKSETLYSSYIKSAPTVKMSYDVAVEARSLLGDEAGDWAAMVVHSQVELSLRKERTSTGAPLLVDPQDGSLPRYLGIPVVVSDRLTATDSVYPSLLLKRGSLAAWVAGAHFAVEEDKDVLKHSTIRAAHLYFAATRYEKLAGMSKPGVVIIKTLGG